MRTPRKRPPKDRLAFEVSPELKARVMASADERGQKLVAWLSRACEAELARSDPPAKVQSHPPSVMDHPALAVWRD